MTKIGHMTPHAWAMDGYIRLINNAGGIVATLPDIGIILGMTAVFAASAAAAARRDRTA
jgi:ABC-2 type transport system permease protein